MPAYDPMDLLEAWLLALIEQDEQKAAARAQRTTEPKRLRRQRSDFGRSRVDCSRAIALVRNGVSVHGAARAEGVAYGTLRRQLRKETQ